jgi:glycosyltransferase involved in cell wall biosynthesis
MPIETPIAYLLSQYPGVSLTFYNEIAELRRLGFTIPVASINTPAKNLPFTGKTRAAAAAAYYIKATPKLRAAGFCLKTLATRPLLFFRGLYAAVSIESLNPARLLLALFYFAEALLLGEWMEQKGLRHLHIHFGGPVASVGRIAAAAYRFPYSLTLHGPDEFSDEALFHLREKLANASFVICISDFSRSQVMRLLPPEQWDKLHVIRLGVDTDIFLPRPARSFASPVELVCVGRLVAAKGQMVLLQALLHLIQKGHHLRLTLVGDGPSRNVLRKFVKTNGLADVVHFAGPCTHEETQAYLAQADIFVLPSLAEGLPVALMEAMASQLPCISTYVGGVPELITNEVDGLLVSSSSTSRLTDAIERLASDPKLRGRLGEAAREKVLQDYRLRENVQKLAALFEQLVPLERKDPTPAADPSACG